MLVVMEVRPAGVVYRLEDVTSILRVAEWLCASTEPESFMLEIGSGAYYFDTYEERVRFAFGMLFVLEFLKQP